MTALRWVGLSAVVGALFAATACGDLNADLGPDPPPPFVVEPPSKTVDLRAEGFALDCPLTPPARPMYLADGGENGTIFYDSGIYPTVPDRCTAPGTCEYGTSADRECNQVFTCDGEEWTETRRTSCHDSACPGSKATMAELAGYPCELPDAGAADEAMCNVADGLCTCTTGSAGAGARHWECAAPLLRECPLERPLIGQPCNGELYCDYGACRTKRGLALQCVSGRWDAVAAVCSP